MRSLFRLLFSSCFLTVILSVSGQPKSDTTDYEPRDDLSITGFPIVFNLPETSWGFGALGLTVFNFGDQKAWRKSQVQVGVAYTLKNQFLLFIPYELYFGQKWKLNGELGYYRYVYNYFGIGADTKEKDLETYSANYPRFFATVSYRVTNSFLLGVQYHFDSFNIPETDSLLRSDDPPGADGGLINTLGLVASYDTRDDIFYPGQGFFINIISEFSGRGTLADYTYALFSLSASHYLTLSGDHILAAQFFTGSSSGNLPFFNYYYLSSPNRARGYDDRRFIDQHMNLLQLEYRFPLVWRFRGAAFSSVGSLGNTYEEAFGTKPVWSYGMGLRFQLSPKQRNHIRVDVGTSNEGAQVYFTIGEAF